MRERVGMPRLRLINPRNPLNHLVENDVARRFKEVLLWVDTWKAAAPSAAVDSRDRGGYSLGDF